MLRITRLHLIIAGIGVACLFFGLLNGFRDYEDVQGRKALDEARMTQQAERHKLQSAHGSSSQTAGALHPSAVRSVAVVGEAYQPLRRQFGDIPPISRPLRAAKQYLAQRQDQQAMTSVRESWQALKVFRAKAASLGQTYQVVRGDTLWKIAEAHSPVHAGPGWVTIWKANKALVNNFDRLEVGWTLTIPPERTEYVMPFWKPK